MLLHKITITEIMINDFFYVCIVGSTLKYQSLCVFSCVCIVFRMNSSHPPGLLKYHNKKNVKLVFTCCPSCVSNRIRSSTKASDDLIRFINPVAASVSTVD